MNNNLNNLVNNSKNIKPYNNNIITSNNYLKTNTVISDSGIIVYGNENNITFNADTTVPKSGAGPILELYGNGGKGASVGIHFDTFKSNSTIRNGRNNGNNSATKILAVDNGSYSSDLVFYTTPPSIGENNLKSAVERMQISSNGNININNNLTVNEELAVDGIAIFNDDVYINGTLHYNGSSTFLGKSNSLGTSTTVIGQIGPVGPEGPIGQTGPSGSDGTKIYNGSTVPTINNPLNSKEGDYYVDTSTTGYYVNIGSDAFSIYSIQSGGFQSCHKVLYGNVWLSIGIPQSNNLNSIQYSTDGINWSNITSGGFSNSGNGIYYSGNTIGWIAVGKDSIPSNTIQYSMNGEIWHSIVGTGFNSSGSSVYYANGRWVAIGIDTNGNTIQTSTDGMIWNICGGNKFPLIGNEVYYGNGIWVAVGSASSNNGLYYQSICYSKNGIDWNYSNQTSMGFSVSGYDVKYGTDNYNQSLWIAVGKDMFSNTIQYSTDGQTWNAISNGGFNENIGYNVCFGTDNDNIPLWIAVGVDSRQLYTIQYSYDGKNWYPSLTGGFSNYGKSLYYIDNYNSKPLWIAVGNDNNYQSIQYSYDGKNWSPFHSNCINQYNSSVYYGNSQIIIGSSSPENGDPLHSILYSYGNSSPWKLLFNMGGTNVNSSIIPSITNMYDLGSPNSQFRNIYYSGSLNSISDYRIKENIHTLDSSYTVDSLRPVIYNKKKELESKKEIGFIAHELQEIYPFLVSGEKDGLDTQSINYLGIIGILVHEIQELKKENKEIKERLNKIELV
jgi:hypothetical protein